MKRRPAARERLVTECHEVRQLQCISFIHVSHQSLLYFPPLTSTWPRLNSDVGLEEGEYLKKTELPSIV